MLIKKEKQNKFWYKDFFQKFYLDIYADILASIKTEDEVDFIADILNLPKKSKILDLCGGCGRIAIPLAKKKFNISIQDLNNDFLRIAKKEAFKKKVEIKTILGDMRKIPFSNEFDAVINIFTSFGYLENEKENNLVLRAVSKSLKPKGRFLIDVINGEFLKQHYQLKTWRKVGDDILVLENNQLNHQTKRNITDLTIVDLKRWKIFSTHQNFRVYTFEELKKLLLSNNFKIIRKYGDFRKEEFSTKTSKRIIILAEKL